VDFDEYRVKVGLRIRKARWLLQLTQTQAATQADVDFRYYCELERGLALNPSLEVLHKIASALDRRVSELLDVEPAPRNSVSLSDAVARRPRTGRPPKNRPRR
jgi:transcriptional regulator with XRE-family HTH domain